jgi:pimeloyl-ACP methyl ester carboxylesterase
MPYCRNQKIRIFYQTFGKRENPPLLLIHGLGSNHQDWNLQIPAFIDLFFIISIDLRGHGKSDKPKQLNRIRDHAKDCIACLDHLSMDRCHILGLSLGCFTGFELGIHFPERVLSFISVNGSASVVMKSLKQKLSGISRLLTIIFQNTRAMGRKIANNVFPFENQQKLRQLVENQIASNSKRAYLSALLGLAGWNMESQISKIKCPVLLITAEYDYTPIQAKRDLIKLLDNATLKIVSESHHLVNIEKSSEFNSIVLNFLANAS